MNEEIAALQGQVLALNNVLTQIICQMTPLQAARTAAGLAIEHSHSQQPEEQEGRTPTELRSKHQLTEAYLALLESVSQPG